MQQLQTAINLPGLDNRWPMPELKAQQPFLKLLASPLQTIKQVVIETVCLGTTTGKYPIVLIVFFYIHFVYSIDTF